MQDNLSPDIVHEEEKKAWLLLAVRKIGLVQTNAADVHSVVSLSLSI